MDIDSSLTYLVRCSYASAASLNVATSDGRADSATSYRVYLAMGIDHVAVLVCLKSTTSQVDSSMPQARALQTNEDFYFSP